MLASHYQPGATPLAGPRDEKLPLSALTSSVAERRKALLLMIVACVGKGGSGKSTLSTNLAAIALEACYKVGIVDADPQQSRFLWRCVRGRSDIPVCRRRADALDDAIEAARRASIELLFIDMPPDIAHLAKVARLVDLVLVPTRPTLFDLKVTRALIPLLTSVRATYAVIPCGSSRSGSGRVAAGAPGARSSGRYRSATVAASDHQPRHGALRQAPW